MAIFLMACVEGIIRLFTIFYLHREFSIFLRKDGDCKDVDLKNRRKSYIVIESLDLTRINFGQQVVSLK